MEYINVFGNAKINIALDILGKREDGYHELETIMQSIALSDHIYMRKIFTPKIKVVSNLKWLPTDERNLAYKAANVLFELFNPGKGVYIEITKKIPVSAGLGGGSADCAATLKGIRDLFNFPISNKELLEIGAKLGADIPFCMEKGTMLGSGTGSDLKRLPPMPFAHILLAKPNINVSTKKIFTAFDKAKVAKRPDIKGMIKHIENKDIDFICENLCNVLETVTIEQYPIIDTIKDLMLKNGAKGALMSGSGPTVFGIFKDKNMAYTAMRNINKELRIRETFITSTYSLRRNGN